MRRVTCDATFSLERRMFVRERALFIGVTFYASRIRAGRQSCLLRFKATVRVVTIAALHHSFKDFVMKRLVEVRLHFVMATHAQLRFADF